MLPVKYAQCYDKLAIHFVLRILNYRNVLFKDALFLFCYVIFLCIHTVFTRYNASCKLCAVVKTARFEKSLSSSAHRIASCIPDTVDGVSQLKNYDPNAHVRVLQNRNGGQHAY